MNRFIFIIFSLFVLGISVFGQNSLEKDLKKSFRNYDLVELNDKEVLEKVKTRQPIEVQAYGRYFQFVLTPNDLRAKNYRAVESSDAGEREMARGEVNIYKGKLSDDFGSEVRFTVSEGNVEGLIYTSDNKKFFVSRAANFSKYAAKSEAIVYGEGDLLKTVDLSDDVKPLPDDIESKLDFGFDAFKSDAFVASDEPQTSAALADFKELEVATEADFQWVSQIGGGTAANNEILSILNLVDGIYKRDLNLTVKVTFQHVWTSADPYATSSSINLLNSFLSYWNTNYPVSQQPRDVAHLFTGKFTNQGIAYSGVICTSPSYAYGLTGRSGSVNHLITAHEIGHNLNADHVENSGTCANSIMNPVISFNAATFCETSKSQINTFTSANGRCLTTVGTTPTCTYSISPGSQNFSAAGGSGSVTVTTQSGCGWTASSNQNFISITSATNGSGSGTVSYFVSANSGSSRIGTLTIAGQTFTVNQSGVSSYSISGTVTYGVTASGQTPRGVPGVNLSAAGSSFLSSTTDLSGNYQLSGLIAGGSYTVTASKNGGINGINSLDATRIQQYLVGLTTLTPNQRLAADVDNNGFVNSLDAARMQQYLVGIPSANIIGQWRFVPGTRQYNALTSNLANQDYEAVLVGEVSGNWSPTGAAAFSQDAEQENANQAANEPAADFLNSVSGDALMTAQAAAASAIQSQTAETEESAVMGSSVTVALPSNAVALSGNTIVIPVSIGEIPAGSSIEAYDFSVFYDASILSPLSPPVSNTGTLSAGCSVFSNTLSAGRVAVSGSCAQALTSGSGTLVNLRFSVIGAGNQQTTLSFTNPVGSVNTFQFNNGTPAAVTTDGQFTVTGPTAALVSISGRVLTASGRGVGNVQITLTDAAGNERTAMTSSFGYYRFEGVAAGETITLTAKARRFRFNQSSMVRTTSQVIDNADFVAR